MNKKQREFLVGICEKVAVYALTIGIIAKLLDKEVTGVTVTALAVVSVSTIALGPWVAKGER